METKEKIPCVLAMRQPVRLAAALNDLGFSVVSASSGSEALESVRQTPPVLLVCGHKLPDMTGLELAGRLVWVNALVNCAVVSDLSDEDFHEAAEGLGLLTKLPPDPGTEEAKALFDALASVGAIKQ